MKNKIAILTDSSSSLYSVKHSFSNLFMINLPCFLGNEVYSNFEVYGDKPFYIALSSTKLISKTSQPSVGETVSMFKKIKALGFTDIIYLPISKELSGTYNNGLFAKKMIEDVNIVIVDTRTTASILCQMALTAAKMASMGKTINEIIDKIEMIKNNWGYYLTVDDLTSLVKNGRLSNAKGFIANILRIKPIIQFTQEGKLVALKNVRHYNRALKQLVNLIINKVDEHNGEIHISYTNNNKDLEIIKELIKEKFPNIKVVIYSLPSTVVAHIGIKSIGIGYINGFKDDEDYFS